MLIIYFIITLSYVLLIAAFIYGFNRIKIFHIKGKEAKTKFSILVPFRNETENLPSLLASIDNLEYPKELFEIIFVDDASEDNSVALVENYIDLNSINTKLLENIRSTNSPKKDAISMAIQHAKNDWIITTDADCILPKCWLKSFDAFIDTHEVTCIVAPVKYGHSDSFVAQFQSLDFLSLQGVTIGSFGLNRPFLCNGANFAYEKTTFLDLNGFEGNETIASGDDIFLLEKMKGNYPRQVRYLKCMEAIVSTKAQSSWNDLVAQRVRWVSKMSANKNTFGKLSGFIALLFNALIIVLLTLSFLQLFDFRYALLLFVLKCICDFILIYKTSVFLDESFTLKSFVLSSLIYPFFSVYIAFVSVFSDYTWKGRVFKH